MIVYDAYDFIRLSYTIRKYFLYNKLIFSFYLDLLYNNLYRIEGVRTAAMTGFDPAKDLIRWLNLFEFEESKQRFIYYSTNNSNE